MHTCLSQHGIVLYLTLPVCGTSARQTEIIKLAVLGVLQLEYLSGGALLARITSLALPSRNVLMVER